MSCEFEARVSSLLDGALPEAEAETVRAHITGCDSCRQLEQDFLQLGRALRSAQTPDGARVAEALEAVVARGEAGFWRRRISIPVPLAAAASLVLALFGVWALLGGLSSPEPERAVRPGGPPPQRQGLDRFDHGERAVLYKVLRDES